MPLDEVLHFDYNRRNIVSRKGDSVSVRIHPTNKAVIDWIITNHRAKTGKGLNNDEALWLAFNDPEVAREAVEAILGMGAPPPVDQRPEANKKRSKKD